MLAVVTSGAGDMALALRLGEHKTVPERLMIAATVTLDEVGGVPAIVSSQLRVSARVPGLDAAGFEAVADEASDSARCPGCSPEQDHRRSRAGARLVVTGGTAAAAAALPQAAEGSLVAVLVLASAVWIGGLVAIFVAARVANRTLGRRSG